MTFKQAPTTSVHKSGKGLRAQIDRITAQAEAHGLTDDAAEALIGIDASLFAWRRRMLKGELSRKILMMLAVDVEQTEFEVLTALSRLNWGVCGRPGTEAAIGDIAEEMSIDPSRASRLVSALVNKGYLRRAVAQEDARKTVLRLTPASHVLFEAFMTMKWHVIFEAFKTWEERDIADFERLFSQYVGAMTDAVDKAGDGNSKTENHSEKIRLAVQEEMANR